MTCRNLACALPSAENIVVNERGPTKRSSWTGKTLVGHAISDTQDSLRGSRGHGRGTELGNQESQAAQEVESLVHVADNLNLVSDVITDSVTCFSDSSIPRTLSYDRSGRFIEFGSQYTLLPHACPEVCMDST